MAFARNDGFAIHYEVQGDGPALVLHHGFSGSHMRWVWAGYVDALRERYRLILIDARGHGRSDKPHDPTAYSLQAQAADVAAVLDDLGLARAHYWGFSMGGRIAFALADSQRHRVRTLVIGAAHPYARTLRAEERLDGSDAMLFVQRLYQRTGIDLDTLPAPMREELFANDFRALAAIQGDWPAMESVLPAMNLPCLLYVGDADPYLAKVKSCAAQIPDAQLLVLPGLDHGSAFHVRASVLPVVTAFLERHETST